MKNGDKKKTMYDLVKEQSSIEHVCTRCGYWELSNVEAKECAQCGSPDVINEKLRPRKKKREDENP